MLPSGKPVITSSVTAPPKGPAFAFGKYILSYQEPRMHGRDLTGGVPRQIGPLGISDAPARFLIRASLAQRNRCAPVPAKGRHGLTTFNLQRPTSFARKTLDD